MHTAIRKTLAPVLLLAALLPLPAFAQDCTDEEKDAFIDQCNTDRGNLLNVYCTNWNSSTVNSTLTCGTSPDTYVYKCHTLVPGWTNNTSFAGCTSCSEPNTSLLQVAMSMPPQAVPDPLATYNSFYRTNSEAKANQHGWEYAPVCARQAWLMQYNLLLMAWSTRTAAEQAVYGQLDQCVQQWKDQYQPNPVSEFLTAYTAAVRETNEARPPNYRSCSCTVHLPGAPAFTIRASDITAGQAVYIATDGSTFRVTNASAFNNYSPSGHFDGQNHVHFDIRGATPASTNPTIEGGSYQMAAHSFCTFDVDSRAHRSNHSCFAPGTNIRMADGSYKKIEDIVAGDEVYNPLTKKSATVAQKVAGPEETPLVEISFGERTLTVSQRHPMLVSKNSDDLTSIGLYPTALGSSPTDRALNYQSGDYQVVTAGDIAVGSMVLTEDGSIREVTSYRVLPVAEDQIVYNLSIIGAEGSLEEHVVEAEGFITGDYLVQNDVNRQFSN